MKESTYQELLAYHREGKVPMDTPNEIYQQWTGQYKKVGNHLYYKEKRIVSKSEVTWIISMFHNIPTAAH